jgi:hypothetical protein
MYVCIYLFIYDMYICTYACTHINICIYIITYICMCVYIYMYMCDLAVRVARAAERVATAAHRHFSDEGAASLSLSLSLSHTLSLSLIRTHTHIHTVSLTLSLTHTLSLAIAAGGTPRPLSRDCRETKTYLLTIYPLDHRDDFVGRPRAMGAASSSRVPMPVRRLLLLLSYSRPRDE